MTIRILSLDVTPLIVGRTDELRALHDAARSLTDGFGSFVHLTGEAGIGKTSLLGAVAADLRARRVTVRAAAADETDRRRRAVILRALLSEVSFGVDGDPLDVALAAIERLAADAPLALLADDVHWADDVSVDALRGLARRTSGLGLLLVTSARPLPANVAVRRLQDVAADVGSWVRLSPLDRDDLAELVQGRFGGPPGPALAELLQTTAGNPFLATELLASLADQELVAMRDGRAEVIESAPLPDPLSIRLSSRAFSALADGELLLRAIAAMPGGATADELAPLLDRPLAEVLTLALRAVEGGLLVDTGSTLVFRHELLRQSITEVTPPSIVRTLSRRAAEVLMERRSDPERITSCLLAGAEPDDPNDLERLISVGTSIADSHPSAAADLLRRALDGMPPGDPQRTAVTVQLGWALVAAGRASEVEALLSSPATRAGEREPIAIQRLRGIAASLIGRFDLVTPTYEESDVEHLESRYDTTDPDVIDAAAELALLRVTRGQLQRAAAIVDWVDGSATPATPFRSATVANVRGWLAATAGRFELAADEARRSLHWVGQDATRSATEAPPTLVLAAALGLLGDDDGALRAVRAPLASAALPRWGVPLLQYFAAVTLYRRGDWDDALAEVDAGLTAAEETDMRMSVFWPDAVAALICVARGLHAEARSWLEHARRADPGPSLGSEWLLYAQALAAEGEGDLDRAGATAEGVGSAITATGALALLLNGGADLVRLCLATGRVAAAHGISDGLGTLTTRSASPVAASIAE
jgi:hypothetical protein